MGTTKLSRFLRRVLGVVAVAYLAALVVLTLSLTLIGERWWLTTAMLYLPRAPLLLPLPFLMLLALLARSRVLLVTQMAALLLILFPLMGLRWSWGRAPTSNTLRLRVLTLNVNTSSWGTPLILRQLERVRPDVMVFQEIGPHDGDRLAASLKGYVRHLDDQFLAASRYPIIDVFVPPKIEVGGTLRSARFRRYRLQTPAGLIHVYNVHPMSPREALDRLRGNGIREGLSSGRLLRLTDPPDLAGNSALRLAQLKAVADDARSSPYPVIIAGDTNLPQLSWALWYVLGDFRDGFDEVGSGFGFTYPMSRRGPWMRIDRILAGPELRFTAFEVLEPPVSDHLAVVADLELPRN